MANKKAKPSEDWYFLPQRVQESIKLDITEKNVVAALCNCYYTFNDYALEHDGWFYTTQKNLEELTELSHKQLNRILNKLQLKTIIERKSGTTNHPTQYRLHPKIVELMPKLPKFDNDTYVSLANDTKAVETLKIEEKIDNDTQDKIREEKKRQEKSFLFDTTYISNVDEKEKEVGSSFSNHQQFNSGAFYAKWVEVFNSSKTEEQLKEFYKKAQLELLHNCENLENDIYIEKLQDEFNMLRAHLHFKKQK